MIRYWLNGKMVGVDDRRARREEAAVDAAIHAPNYDCPFDTAAFFAGRDNI